MFLLAEITLRGSESDGSGPSARPGTNGNADAARAVTRRSLRPIIISLSLNGTLWYRQGVWSTSRLFANAAKITAFPREHFTYSMSQRSMTARAPHQRQAAQI